MLKCRRHPKLLPLAVALSSLLLSVGAATKVSFGFCPEYQTDSTSMNPDIAQILQDAGDHYIVSRLPASDEENVTSCAFVSFVASPPSFIYSYTDDTGPQTLTGSFKVIPRTVSHSGYIEMTDLPKGVLGANHRGVSQLHFISVSQVGQGVVMLLLRCHNGFLMHFESAYVTMSKQTTLLENGRLSSGTLYNATIEIMWQEQQLYPVGETYMVDQTCYDDN